MFCYTNLSTSKKYCWPIANSTRSWLWFGGFRIKLTFYNGKTMMMFHSFKSLASCSIKSYMFG